MTLLLVSLLTRLLDAQQETLSVPETSFIDDPTPLVTLQHHDCFSEEDGNVHSQRSYLIDA